MESGSTLHTLEGHSGSAFGVAVTPDGKQAVSASYDNTLKVWDLEARKALATFTCDGVAYCCTYSDARKLIVAATPAATSTSSASKNRNPTPDRAKTNIDDEVGFWELYASNCLSAFCP